ncbi:MAG: serine/threonine protein kinase [Planctomycetales bacterium]
MNPFSLFRRDQSLAKSHQVRMTWAGKSLGTAVSRTGVFLKRQLWVWPVIATVLLAILGLAMHRSIAATMKANLRSQLETLLTVETAMLSNWYDDQTSNATSLANSPAVRDLIAELMLHPDELPPDTAPADRAVVRRKLLRQISPTLSAHGYTGFMVLDKSRTIIATDREEMLDQKQVPEYEGFSGKALKGKATVSPPFASVVAMRDESGRRRTGVPTMFVAVPIRDASFEVVAALCLRIAPDDEFTRILQLGRFGESGETYAFERTGLMASNSRFDEELVLIGILPDRDDARSILNVQLRDPGGDMSQGFRAAVRRSERPLCRNVAEAIAGRAGVDIEGYRNYRGVPTLGAWTWLADYDLGVATEIDLVEAYRPLTILQWTFRGLLGLLAGSSLAIFLFTVRVARLKREAQKAALEVKQLGQYTLEKKLGAGGMGVVYKGHHAMMRRATAIKMLDVERINDASIQRFEREVQITCQLNHPNTVAIYDYGRTPEGVFYYAMEYLDGIDLQTLVEKYGPQPEERVIQILRQVCGSLFEAHTLGLVHRDIKPANIMLNRRGGEADVVKVLDFGLVKAVDDAKQVSLTVANSLTGTPLYMAPEAIQSPNSVDARSDLYAVGAVGYFLLTGSPVFEAENLVQLCQQQIDAVPIPPSQRLGRPVSQELEKTLLRCLEKLRVARPQTARELAVQLQQIEAAHVTTSSHWTAEEAETWWDRHDRGLAPAPASGTPPQSTTQAPPSASSPSSPPAADPTRYDRTIITE